MVGNFKNMEIKRSYISQGDENIADDFINPMLKCTKLYRRSVGFFSSGVLDSIMEGITYLARNRGRIQLIASPKLNAEDIEAINKGYEKREIITNSFSRDFVNEIQLLDDNKLNLLSELIAAEILDIKIVTTNTSGDYHDKFGILEDFDDNQVVFYGSPNSSNNGYRCNYEKIRVVRSWVELESYSVDDEIKEFDSMWNNTNPHLKIYDYKESAQQKIIEVIKIKASNNKKSKTVELRDYQETAISKWIENDYKGFLIMATGTGKTWTAIFAAQRLLEEHSGMIVICAPYKHLVKQWNEDIEKMFPESKIILISSENVEWEQQLSTAIVQKKYNNDVQIIVISTIKSFNSSRFKKTINKSAEDKLLIVDEAHRFTNLSNEINEKYKYMLALSATPYGSDMEKSQELIDFFGGEVFKLSIEDALDRGFLVPYKYVPIFVGATDYEEENFLKYTKQISTCFRNNRCINKELLVKASRQRVRIIAMAQEKQDHIDAIIDQVADKDHFIVYCGDGKLFDNNTGEEKRHIQHIKDILTNHGLKASQFTASENMKERMLLVDSFNKGEISTLAAIRCLDEGINIPSIKSALIIASNDNYREFVQRRGRILRLYEDKKEATIYDVIVLPSTGLKAWAKIELRRFLEYGRLAQNWESLRIKLEEQLDMYGLTMDDIDIYNFGEVEDELDE